MKTLNLFAAFLFSAVLSGETAKAQSFKEGTNSLNIGIGFLGGYNYGTYSGISQTPALSAYYEHGVMPLGPGTLGIGGGLEYKSLSYDYSFGNYSAKWKYTIIGLRGAYHPDFANSEKVDGYGGLALGYGIVSFKDSYYDNAFGGTYQNTYPSYFYTSFFLGVRYLFSPKVGGFAEIGSGLTALKIGVNFHF